MPKELTIFILGLIIGAAVATLYWVWKSGDYPDRFED